MLLVSCKGKITDIKITPTKNYRNYNPYMLNYGSRPDSGIIAIDCPWIKDAKNTVFMYMPISFKLENNTGRRLRISKLWDNYNIETYLPMIIDNKFYDYVGGKVFIESGNKANITMFVHLPIPINSLEKSYTDRLFPPDNNRKLDSIVVNKIDPKLQKEIDILLKKKEIYTSYHENKNVRERALAYYCFNKQELSVFKSDSLAKLKISYKHSCD
jgi:hypothetical protein